MSNSQTKIVVTVADQTLRLLEGGHEVASFSISTARNGLGFAEGSLKTPTGRFRICRKIGEGEPLGMIFKGRKPTGRIGTEADPGDSVQTRILWLDGCDPENANTKDRYIYIHGTNHESTIGRPESQGCVRMRNEDVVWLFERVSEGTPVEIER